MTPLMLFATLIGMLLFWGLLMALVIGAVFYAFNFVPWNGIRRRPQPLSLPTAVADEPAMDASAMMEPASASTSTATVRATPATRKSV